MDILFPTKKDNPFLSLVLQFLNLPSLYYNLLMAGIYVMVVYISCVGLETLREEFFMKKMNRIIGTLVAAIVTTITLLVINLLVLMFSHRGEGYATSFFGSVFIRIEENTADWDLYTTLGVTPDHLSPIIISIILFWGLYFIFTTLYQNRNKKLCS